MHSLAQEARRSLPQVQQDAERVLMELRKSSHAVTAAGGTTPASSTARDQVVQLLHPFLLSCNFLDAPRKVILLSLSAMQKMLVSNLLSVPLLASIVRVLDIQVREPVGAVARGRHSMSGSGDVEMPEPASEKWQGFTLSCVPPPSPFPFPPCRVRAQMMRCA